MSTSHRRRVVVTGMGVVTPVGSTVESMWASLVAGRSGVGHIRRIDASTFPTTIGAEVTDLAAYGVFGVFVESGSVTVTGVSTSVTLAPGLGTNIARPGGEPTAPARWGAARIAAAMASVN